MDKLRNMTSIYLRRGDKLLLLYRIGSRVIGNSYTGTAGGHMEEAELNNPRACVLRELQEETGLSESDVENLQFRYITLRLKNGEVRQNYYFFAELPDGANLSLCSNEGTLKWVSLTDLFRYEMPATAKQMLEHWRTVGRGTNEIYGGVTNGKTAVFTEITLF